MIADYAEICIGRSRGSMWEKKTWPGSANRPTPGHTRIHDSQPVWSRHPGLSTNRNPQSSPARGDRNGGARVAVKLNPPPHCRACWSPCLRHRRSPPADHHRGPNSIAEVQAAPRLGRPQRRRRDKSRVLDFSQLRHPVTGRDGDIGWPLWQY